VAGDSGRVYGHAVEILTAEEGGAFGAALMAGVGAGAWADLDAACAAGITVAERIEPDPAWVAAYAAGYEKWRKLYPALATLFPSGGVPCETSSTNIRNPKTG
jgi:xylulokinase